MHPLHIFLRFSLVVVLVSWSGSALAADPLPSWNEGDAKRTLLDFVACATDENCPNFIPAAERIATFDNDGTLWCEQPVYNQAVFTRDRLIALAKDHPEWKSEEPYKSLLENDRLALADVGEQGLVKLIAATHTGMTTGEFDRLVKQWFATARHPRFQRPYSELVYHPMVELLEFLRANGFKTFIVSGGGQEFMRAYADKAYGIPSHQIVGSTGRLKYELNESGEPEIRRLTEIDFIDDGPGKPVGIQKQIGIRPALAFGNSDGDYEMLRWTTADTGTGQPRLGLIVHHDDAEREYAYDHPSPIGQLKRALAEANERGWVVVSMQRDWKTVFAK
jgi:phosphoglycolate phosphatase-like HAD superfamily hydrolase